MGISTTFTPYGRSAYEAMRDVVREAKQHDPLAPVTLLVPTEQAGVTARRFLACGLDADRPGIAALTILTLRRLGELLAGQALAAEGRRPLTDPVLAATVRGVLAVTPGLFEQVRDHTGTVRALARAHRQLRDLDPIDRRHLEGHSALVDDVLRLHGAIRAATHEEWFDAVDLTQAATAQLRRRPKLAEPLGTVVGVLLQDLDVHERRLLEALGEVSEVHLLVGLTGDRRADAGPLRVVAPVPAESPGEQPIGHRVLHATDPDDEVRCVVREVVSALRAGTPGHRIAVLYGSADPYARLLHEHLANAEVTIHGRGVRPTAERLLGRALLRVLALPRHGYRRDEVMAIVADAPVRWQGRRAPSTAWERASRDASVVRDNDWQRLQAVARSFRQRARQELERPENEVRQWVVDRDERTADTADTLHAFVVDLQMRLGRLDAAPTWSHAAEELQALWRDVLGGDDTSRYPMDEQRAADRVAQVVDSLAGLDALPTATSPGLDAVREVIELELADDLDRVGVIGHGVHVGPVSDAVGLDVDVVVVVGLAEGLLPGRHGDDPLLPDELRERTAGALPTLRERLDRQHRHVLAALGGGRQRLLTFPRGDLRRGGERVPSRWLLPTLRRLTGNDALQASGWQSACRGVDDVVEIPSHATELERADTQVTDQEWRQRAVLARASMPDDDRLASVLELSRARRSPLFTRFDGNLSGVDALPDPREQSPLSPTALEAWTACPHHYLMAYVLGVAAVEHPEALVRIDNRDRGTIVHDVLEKFVEENLGRSPDAPWTDDDAKRFDELADGVFADAERRGITGFPLLWERDREALRADLHAWLAEDSSRRSARRAAPAVTELPFGTRGRPPVVLDLGDGTTLRLKGKADRVDRVEDGGLLVVDYKTGRRDYWPELSSDDPTLHGLKLQLPIYALAARQHLNAHEARVWAEYWFVNRASRFGTIGYDVDDGVYDEARRVVRGIVDGIAGGLFVARPRNEGNKWGCETCDRYGRGESDVQQAWKAMLEDAALAAYLQLIGETPEVD